MKRFFASALCFAACLIINAQDNIKISTPEVSFLNEILTIKYDITGCGTNDYINIRLVVLDSEGDTIIPTYITGDLGSRISCGFGKKIEWNMVRDSVLIDEEIEIQVTGSPLIPEIPLYTQPVSKQISRGNILLSSVFLPGLGQKKASGKGGPLVLSGLVYGTAGASLGLFLQHKNLYEDYKAASGTERDELYEKQLDKFNMSQYLLYGSAGIWAINMIWSAVIPIKEPERRRMELSFGKAPIYNSYLLSAKWSF